MSVALKLSQPLHRHNFFFHFYIFLFFFHLSILFFFIVFLLLILRDTTAGLVLSTRRKLTDASIHITDSMSFMRQVGACLAIAQYKLRCAPMYTVYTITILDGRYFFFYYEFKYTSGSKRKKKKKYERGQRWKIGDVC